ncbi:MAG TPA: hypothetical protein PK324_08105, partial [Nocardioides sp.]|nr:hypothetical protein [Nocardioides sp.]
MSSRVMQNVDVWPPSGHLDEPWDSNPDVDAFCKSARSVTVVYSIGLRELRLPAFRSWLRFGCGRVSTDGRVRVTVSVDRLEGDLEHASVVLPAGIAEWAPSDRARLALEVVHAGMVRLGESRGWEREELERLRDLTLQRGLEHTLVGDWKASPDRRHSARTCYRIAPDGLGRARLEVADRDGVVVATSPEAIAPAGFRPGISATRDLRWDGVDRVALTTLRRTFRGVEVSVALVREGAAWRGEISDGNDARVPLAGL